MEIKKSKEADLEGKRTTMFLMGIILVLSVLFVAFEFTTTDSSADVDDELLRDLLHPEEDLIPLLTQKELARPLPPKQEKSAETLEIVEETAESSMPDKAGEGDEESEEEPFVAPSDTPDNTKDIEEAPPTIVNAETNPLNFRIVEDLPEFPGGPIAFMKWLTENLQYPASARREKVQGRVVAQFIVDSDGSITDLKIVTSLNPACDKEALRVLGKMPEWKPGKQNDSPCRTMVAIPIVFKL
ncbi:MAG: energy transducer TonB [Prevotella sp.]